MYRVFCESYQNFLQSFDEDCSRLKISKPLELLVNTDKYKEEKEKNSNLYLKTCDLLYYMQKNIKKYPKLKAFIWTLKSRDIVGKQYKIAKKQELEEQINLVNSFLQLAYWY